MKKRQIKEIKRFSKYLVGGNAQFWSGYGAYAALDLIFSVSFWPAKIAAYFIGVSVNFVIERFWAFGGQNISKRQVESSAEKFYLLMFVNFLLDLGIVGGLREIGITPYIGQFVSAGFFTFWNYILFKIWVFAKVRKAGKAK